jgi:L-histidine Nalpha-methyltransferase
MSSTTPAVRSERFALYRDPHPVRVATFAEDVVTGLGVRPYTLPPKYFYDDLGSALFEAITRLPEYYLTRIERDLLATYASQIVAAFDEPLELVELGSGSAIKTRLIIEAILARQPELTYHPIDISPDALIESSHALVGTHDNLRVMAYASDYFRLLGERRLATRGRVLTLYLGSNVGNFEPAQAAELFRLLGASLHKGDALLIGYDLKKDASVLELAYNDPTGVTAAFNKNLLARINRELHGNFDLGAFSFFARYDAAAGAIRSYLRSDRAQRVSIAGAGSGIEVPFGAGETIHTESSYKFAREEIVATVAAGNFTERKTFTDAANRYALTLLIRS